MISSPPPVIARPRETLLSAYEELRAVALRRSGSMSRGVGFALFTRSGMAAWVEACVAVAAPSGRREPPAPEQQLVLPDLHGELAMVLAAMALSVPMEGGMTA